MSDPKDRLYELLPVVYRQRDAEQEYPLRALLQVIAEQVNVVEADIAQLYENWFIETCEDWVVPYIGDLIGYEPVHEAGEPGEVSTLRGQQRNKILIPRREVANIIRYRRRKGALALLELLTNDVAGWPARAVEVYRLLGWTQHINHLHLHRGGTVDLRKGDALDRLDGPFDELAHTVDIRRIVSHRTIGRYNIPSIGLFVWRLKAYSVTRTPAYCLEEVGPHCYTFSILGNDTPLYTHSEPEEDPTHIAGELNLPTPIRQRAFETRTADGKRGQASSAYYGVNKSLAIWAPNWPGKDSVQPIPPEWIIPADLSGWQYRAPRNRVAVDPELGRISFPPDQMPKEGVWVSYYYGFSADIGGGEYHRALSQPAEHKLYRVGRQGVHATIKAALDQWASEDPKPRSAIVEITDSGVYTEQLNITLEKNEGLQIRAANGARPILRLLDYMAERPDAFSITGMAGSRFTLDGLLITGRSVKVYGPVSEANGSASPGGDLCDVTIRHCTLVPGWAVHSDCEPKRPAKPSLELINSHASVIIEHSIVGSIHVTQDEVKTDPIPILISDSILDATSSAREALGAPGWPVAHVLLTVVRSTVFGQVQVHAIELAEDSLFNGLVRVARRQLGCTRFCYVPPGSRTPRRYNCQPDLVVQAIEEKMKSASRDEIAVAQQRERDRVRPWFNSSRYGTPVYCQLAHACADEIRRGADDESEMGVFHDLYQPQRAANLRIRLEEYIPAGTEAGIIYAS